MTESSIEDALRGIANAESLAPGMTLEECRRFLELSRDVRAAFRNACTAASGFANSGPSVGFGQHWRSLVEAVRAVEEADEKLAAFRGELQLRETEKENNQ